MTTDLSARASNHPCLCFELDGCHVANCQTCHVANCQTLQGVEPRLSPAKLSQAKPSHDTRQACITRRHALDLQLRKEPRLHQVVTSEVREKRGGDKKTQRKKSATGPKRTDLSKQHRHTYRYKAQHNNTVHKAQHVNV